jgi:hypothetical protein
VYIINKLPSSRRKSSLQKEQHFSIRTSCCGEENSRHAQIDSRNEIGYAVFLEAHHAIDVFRGLS